MTRQAISPRLAIRIFLNMPDFRLYNTLTRASSRSLPPRTARRCACTRAVRPSTTRRTSETSARSSSRTCCGACFALRGWQVHQVMNLTDVDDKIIKRAAEQGMTIREVTEPVTEIFHRDREYLRIEDGGGTIRRRPTTSRR